MNLLFDVQREALPHIHMRLEQDVRCGDTDLLLANNSFTCKLAAYWLASSHYKLLVSVLFCMAIFYVQ